MADTRSETLCTQTRIEAALAQQRTFMDTWGAQLEQMLQLCVVLVPVQDQDHDKAGFWSQVVYSASDLFNLYRSVVLRSPEEIPVCEAVARGEGSGPSKELRRARLGYMLAAFLLRAIRSIQVLIEMDAMRRQGAAYALRVCTRIEMVKLVLKVFLRTRMPFSFYVDEAAIEDAEPPKLEREGLLGQRANATPEASPEGAPEAFVGRRSGRALKPLTEAAPPGAPAPSPPPPRVADGLRRDCTRLTSQIEVAEVMHHARPLVHLMMLRMRGRQSWAAWFTALVLDRASANLLAMELRCLPRSRASLLEAAEVSRRQNQVWWALLRSPFFDRVLRRPSSFLECVLKKIPVINMFNIVELLMVLQPFYFSTSGS